MALLEIGGLRKLYGTTVAVDDVSLAIDKGEIVTLLGPSGCGKTTVLRIVAGLEPDYDGSVLLDGNDLRGLPANERDFGLMFQDLALFPHMDVFANVSFGLRMLRVPRAEQSRRVADLLDLVGLSGKEKSSVFELSGGERQRVALARSLAPEPRLLMLDEPLGALDRNLRESLAGEIRDVLKSLGMTALYVTHDQDEGLAIADRVAIMNQGRIEQVASLSELLRRPASEFVARFLGFNNLLPATVRSGVVTVDGLDFNPQFEIADGTGMLLIPEEAIAIDPNGARRGKVIDVTNRGRRTDTWAEVGNVGLHFSSPAALEGQVVGSEIGLSIDQEMLHFIPHSTDG